MIDKETEKEIEELTTMFEGLKEDVKDICQIVREQNNMIFEIMGLNIPEVNNIIHEYAKKSVSNASKESK